VLLVVVRRILSGNLAWFKPKKNKVIAIHTGLLQCV
jgi:hypothetical protein